MDVLILRLCFFPNSGLLCGSLNNNKVKLDVCAEGNKLIHLSCEMGNYIWMDGCWLAVNLLV